MNFTHGKDAYAMLTRGAVTMLVKIIIFTWVKWVHPTFLDFFFYKFFKIYEEKLQSLDANHSYENIESFG